MCVREKILKFKLSLGLKSLLTPALDRDNKVGSFKTLKLLINFITNKNTN